MTPASTSDARKRLAEKAAGYDAWRLARTTEACVYGTHDDCDGLAYDADEHRVIACLCGCGHHERGAE